MLNIAMNVAARLAGWFTSNIKKRGEAYYRQRRVHIEEASDSSVWARVQGSYPYDVELNFSNGILSMWCGCAYFGPNNPCKHIWATVLMADQHGYLGQFSSAARFSVSIDDDEVDEDDDDEDDDYQLLAQSHGLPAGTRKPREQSRPSWHRELGEFLERSTEARRYEARWPVNREFLYVVDVAGSRARQGLYLALRFRERKMNGSWGALRPIAVSRSAIGQMPNAEDRGILSALAGGDRYGYYAYDQLPESILLRPELAGLLMPRIVVTGRGWLQPENRQAPVTPLTWDEQGSWHFELEIKRIENRGFALGGRFRRGEECMDLSVPVLVIPGLVFTADKVAPLAVEGEWEWISALLKKGALAVREKDKDEFLAVLLAAPNLPPLVVPDEISWQEVNPPAQPRLKIFKRQNQLSDRLSAELSFAYEGQVVFPDEPIRGFFDAASRCFLRRDFDSEGSAAFLLDQLGVKLRNAKYQQPDPLREITPNKLPHVVRSLLTAGWYVEAEKKIFRRPGSYQLEISSGIDWFELDGKVDYGTTTAHLPELLEAFRRGDQMVQLTDGSYGMIPEEWLRQFGPLAAMGTVENGGLRFKPTQAALLDALLATQPGVHCDDRFAALRDQLREFDGVTVSEQPAGFAGKLRDYQREGLGWIEFLRRFSFGGCLADDMGVGKTAQVLALLETRRVLRTGSEPHGPSLVVVPKSLVFNWKQEASRFTPQLRMLDYTGVARDVNNFPAYDMVLTTYGTVRRDIVRLKDFEFDYVVLDEAQAIKNAHAQSSKAVRLLRGRHRLALSGTPVENHLGELWSLFEFLNPGMLGSASVFKLAGGKMITPDEQTSRLLSQALRPFILRRTKEQVARELPSKSEQTLYCEMETAERRRYEDLRQHYRASLLHRIETEGMAKSKIHVLEALLRLRQAACHPGLLSAERRDEPSAKLELLLEQLQEVLESGHKALVFSQFTSFLKIVRDRLDRAGILYEYLDGSTHDRQARVERFQTNKECGAFLISLKAGGLGLNLTAAEYIFILDPWWNPAVEAQAVDRAHRIGQTLPVFAYRLITRETVEEKVLELQKVKRNLADSIITGHNSLIRNLQPDDLALLLS